MANTITRRPLPALVSLVALLALTGIVWLRVLNRDTGDSDAAAKSRTPAPCTSAAPATRTLPAPSTVTVVVLNSTTRTGIAGKARTALLADGFTIPGDAKNDLTKVKVTAPAEIRYGAAGRQGARLLRYYFPGATVKGEKTTGSTVTVSLGTGYKAVASPSAVRAAMARDRVAIAPAKSSGTASPTATGSTSASATPTC